MVAGMLCVNTLLTMFAVLRMAVVLLCNKLLHNEHTFHPLNAGRELDNGPICKCSAVSSRRFTSSSNYAKNRLQVLHPSVNGVMKRSTSRGVFTYLLAHLCRAGNLKLQIMTDLPSPQRVYKQNFCTGRDVSSCCAKEKQLGSLDSYFEKLYGEEDQPSSDSCDKITDLVDEGSPMNVKAELDTLNSYLEKLDKDEKGASEEANNFNVRASEETPAARTSSVCKEMSGFNRRKQESFVESRNKDVVIGSTSSQALQNDDETSDLYFIGILASINIAVFLFEVASPIRGSEVYSLPLAYGAKINDLIMVGEWWRLVTPMFLHSGIFHMALGCWSLLTFGPQVCRGYGTFTFFLIYILGGVSGNLTSFLLTAEPTVGGTGPIFAVIGAWLIYQTQNKHVIPKDVADDMYQKAVITTGLCFILSHFGPVDDWTHLGAAVTGIAYSFFTCPTLQLDEAARRKGGQDEGIALVRRNADACKSVAVFTLFILFLSSLLFVVEPPLDTTL